jgi:hypothetical protein
LNAQTLMNHLGAPATRRPPGVAAIIPQGRRDASAPRQWDLVLGFRGRIRSGNSLPAIAFHRIEK